MKYNHPFTKDGKIQHVPIVIKNRDMLVGYLRAYGDMLSSVGEIVDLTDEETLSKLTPQIDSSRFNDYIDDGVDAKKMTQDQLDDFRKEMIDSISLQPENEKVELDVGFFSMDCACGNFITFKTVKEVPFENFICDICERTLIHYIHVDDEDVEVDGEKE